VGENIFKCLVTDPLNGEDELWHTVKDLYTQPFPAKFHTAWCIMGEQTRRYTRFWFWRWSHTHNPWPIRRKVTCKSEAIAYSAKPNFLLIGASCTAPAGWEIWTLTGSWTFVGSRTHSAATQS